MALGFPTDPWNNRYLGTNPGGGDQSQVTGAVNNRVGGFNIWPYNASGQQNRPGVVGQVNSQDVSATPSTNRRINNQDTSAAPPTAPPADPPVNPFFPSNPNSSSAAFRNSLVDQQSGQPFAPTAAQVNANPSGYAGTSFDPARSTQFQAPTGLANSTNQDTRDSNGETIRGFIPYGQNNPNLVMMDPYAKPTTDRQGNRIDLNANQGNADALLRMYPELQALGWGGSNRRNMGDWLGDQATTRWLYENPAYGLTDTPQRRAVTEAFRSNPLFSTGETAVTPQNYQQIVDALDAIDPRIADYWGPRRIY